MRTTRGSFFPFACSSFAFAKSEPVLVRSVIAATAAIVRVVVRNMGVLLLETGRTIQPARGGVGFEGFEGFLGGWLDRPSMTEDLYGKRAASRDGRPRIAIRQSLQRTTTGLPFRKSASGCSRPPTP
jgi:hypothetical protein